MEKQKTILELSWTSVLKFFAVLIGIYLVYVLSEVFLVLFVVVILAAALSPLVERIKNKLNIPRLMAILLIYLVLLVLVAIVAYTIIPLAADQVRHLNDNLPDYAQKITRLISSINDSPSESVNTIQSASSTVGKFADTFVKSASSFFGGIATVFYILILTLFLIMEEDEIRKFFVSLMPISQKGYIIEVSKKISEKLGSWLLGQVTLMGAVGFLTGIGMWVVGVPYALTLGILAGFMEIIPTIGPILAAIPAALIAYMDAPWKAVFVLIFSAVIQQLENQVLVPKIMQKVLGISPFVILVALLIGGNLAGILGVLLAVPTVATISVLVKEWPNIRSKIK